MAAGEIVQAGEPTWAQQVFGDHSLAAGVNFSVMVSKGGAEAAGGTVSMVAGVDTAGQVCSALKICGRFGVGEGAAAGLVFEYGRGNKFAEGDSGAGGWFLEFGRGRVSGIDISADSTNVTGGADVRLFIERGRISAAGGEACFVQTRCLNPR